MAMTAAFSSGNYPQLFRDFILRALQGSLAQVQASRHTLPTVVRDQALHTLTFALKLADAWPLTRTLLLDLAPKMEQMGQRDEWIPFLKQGLQQSQQFNDWEAVAYLHLQLGMLYQFRACYAQAVTHLTQSVADYAKLGQPGRQAEALNRLAYIAHLRRQHTVARALVDKALTILSEDDPGRSFSHFVLGWVASDAETYEQAIEHFQHALKLSAPLGDQRLAALYLGNLGAALRKLGRLEQAMTCYADSIAGFGAVQDQVQQAVMQMNLGNLYLIQQQPQNALALYRLAEPIFRAAQDETHLALLTMNLGIALRESGQLIVAEQTLLAAIEQWRRLENLYCLVNSWDELGLVYLAQACPTQAANAFQQGFEQVAHLIDQSGYTSLFESLTQHTHQLAAVAPTIDGASQCWHG